MDYCFVKGGLGSQRMMFGHTSKTNHRKGASQFDAILSKTQNTRRDTQHYQAQRGISREVNSQRKSDISQERRNESVDRGISKQVTKNVNESQQKKEKGAIEAQNNAVFVLLAMLAEDQVIDIEQLALLKEDHAQALELLNSFDSVEMLIDKIQGQSDVATSEQLGMLEKLYNLIAQMQLAISQDGESKDEELYAILALLSEKIEKGAQKIQYVDDAHTKVERGIDQTAYLVNQHQAQQIQNQDMEQQDHVKIQEEDGILALKETDNKENQHQEGQTQQGEGDLNLQGKFEVINLGAGKEEQLNMHFHDMMEVKEEAVGVESAKKAHAMPSAERMNIFNQVVESAKVVLQEGKSEMTLQLKPENLGRLSVEIVTERGMMVARFEAESQQVKEIIESSLSQLKDALESQGLNVQGFSVSVSQQDAQRQAFQKAARAKVQQVSKEEEARQNEQYSQESIVVNPYDISDSSIDFTA